MGLAKETRASETPILVETSGPLSLNDLLEVFGNMIDRSIGPVSSDLQQLRSTLAGPLSRMNDQLQRLTIDLEAMSSEFRADRYNLDERVTKLEVITSQHGELLREIRSVMKILKGVGAALGGLIVTLIWSIMTGQVRISFP